MTKQPNVFISYVRENSRLADYIADILRANGIEPFLDRDQLKVGTSWRNQLEQSVRSGDFYLPIFTREWAEREKTQANEELLWAVEELRQRPGDRAWFAALVVDQGAFQERDIGAGRKLSDLQYADVPNHGWNGALTRLLAAMGVTDPILDPYEPLAQGFGSRVRATGGHFSIHEVVPAMPNLANLEFQVSEGLVFRQGDRIVADLNTRSPNTEMQRINELIGTDALYAISDAASISTNADDPTRFECNRSHVIPRGLRIPPMLGNGEVVLPFDMSCHVRWVAHGYLVDDRFCGTFEGSNTIGTVAIQMAGKFDVQIANEAGPTPRPPLTPPPAPARGASASH